MENNNNTHGKTTHFELKLVELADRCDDLVGRCDHVLVTHKLLPAPVNQTKVQTGSNG